MKIPTRQIKCELCGKPIISTWPETTKLEIKHNPLCAFWNEYEFEDENHTLREEYDLAN